MQIKITKDIEAVGKQRKDSEVVEKNKKFSVHSATVEEALVFTGFGKYNLGLLLICSWTLQAMGMDLFGSSFVVAASVCDLELTMQQRALLTAMPLVGVVAGAQIWGYIADTRGRRLTITLSMSVGFVFAAMASLAPDWRTMAVLKLLSSTFTSATNSGAYTLLGESCSASVRGRAMLLCTCALMCSQAAAAVMAYPILPLDFSYHIPFLNISYRSWRLLALCMSLPCLASACLLRLFHESPKFLASIGQYDEALEVLRKIYACNTGESADCFPVKKLQMEDESSQSIDGGSFFKSVWLQTVPLFRKPLLNDTMKLFYLVAVIYMTGSGFILWLPYIMNNLFLMLETGGGSGMNLCTVISYSAEASSSGNATVVAEVCNDTIQETTLLSSMAYGAVASSTNVVLSLTCGGRKRVAMMGILATAAVAAVLMNVVTSPIAGGIFFFVFLMSALTMGILSVYFVEMYPTNLRGMASCLSVMLGRSSAFVGVNAIGALISIDCEATFYAWAVLLLSAVAFAWFLPKDNAANK